MNTCTISGWVQGAAELRVCKDGRRILNFEVDVEGPGREPFCPCAYFLAPGESPTLEAGERVLVVGVLRHHRMRGLFVGASEIIILADDKPRQPRAAAGEAAPRPASEECPRRLNLPRPENRSSGVPEAGNRERRL